MIEMDEAYDFSPPTLSTDGKVNCTHATAERNSCCTLSRKTTEPTMGIDLGKVRVYEIFLALFTNVNTQGEGVFGNL